MDREIKTLTTEEIQTLQVDQALKLLGEHTQIRLDLNTELSEALIEFGRVKLKIAKINEDIKTIQQIDKNLAMIVKFSI